jgi:DNA-binding NarL/FixJ family response regulator
MRAVLAHLQGHNKTALQILDDLISAAPNVSPQHIIPAFWELRGRVRTSLKEFDSAEQDLLAAQMATQLQGNRTLLWRIHTDLGRLYKMRRQHTRAEKEFSIARSLVQELAQTIPEKSLRDLFLERAGIMIPSPLPPTPRAAAKDEFGGLTNRERQVAAGIADGLSNREIAESLVLSEYTVATHVGNIFNKLGFTSRAQVAAWAAERGLVKPKPRR